MKQVTIHRSTVTPFESIDWAVYRSLWNVPARYSEKLNRYFLLDMRLGEFEDSVQLDRSFDWRELLPYDGHVWEVAYYHCSYESLEDFPPETKLLISMRECTKIGCRIALVTIKKEQD